jgi:hypothetical protein
MSDDNDTLMNTDRETLREGFQRYKDGTESTAADKLIRLREFLEARYPGEWQVREDGEDEVGVAMRLLSFNRLQIKTGEQIFDILRASEAVEELTRKLQLELSDKGIAYYLRTTADASSDDDEARLLRDAADVLEHPIL